MADVLTTGVDFLNSLGLPQILLWLITFAIVFEVLLKAKILSRAPATLVAIAVGLFVLMAVPSAVIYAIEAMSTGLVVAAIGFVVILALIEVGNIRVFKTVKNDKGQDVSVPVHPFHGHGKIMTITVLVIAALIFIMAGGPQLIGVNAIPTLNMGAILLIIIAGAVLWMISESKEKN
jgi:hypothetical protein